MPRKAYERIGSLSAVALEHVAQDHHEDAAVPYYFFVWDEDTEESIAQHGVTWEEFEEVVQTAKRREASRTSGLPIAIGWTSSGKYIACIYEELDVTTVRPHNAYEVEP